MTGFAIAPAKRHLLPHRSFSGLIKGDAISEPGAGLVPAFSASGQDVWIPETVAYASGRGVVLSAVGARCGKVFLADFNRWGTVANTQSWSIAPTSDARFVAYLLNDEAFWQKAGAAQPYVLVGESLRQTVPLPSRQAQADVADYLDRETAEIDAFIADQEELTALLEERASGLIDRTLAEAARGTRDHRLGYDTSLITSGSRGWAEFYSDAGEPFLRIGNLSRGSYRLKRRDIQHVTVPANAEGARTRTRSGDLLFSITAFLGAVGVVSRRDAGSYVSQHIALVRLRSRVNPYFYAYQALGTRIQDQLKSGAYGGTKVQLALGDIAAIHVFHPSLSIQSEVVARLDDGTAAIEAAIADAGEAIALSKERRAALVSAAVTGQINVTQRKRVLV